MEDRRFVTRTLALAVALLLLTLSPAAAYNNLYAHPTINEYAIKEFEETSLKYDEDLKGATLDGAMANGIAWDFPEDRRVTLPSEGLVAQKRQKSMREWITDAGFSADEPEGTMGLLHFYDPTNPSEPYLSNDLVNVYTQVLLGSPYRNPETDAITWAIEGKDSLEGEELIFIQDYSWNDGKRYLKEALASTDRQNENYGKAWRSLGETMHLIADMTVPAHVRNDAHPYNDPYEAATGAQAIRYAQAFSPAALNYDAGSLRNMMHAIALYTNNNFVTSDTVPLPPGISSPKYHNYPKPDLNAMTPRDDGYIYQQINGKDLRVARTRSALDQWWYGGGTLYQVDKRVINDQQIVLIPTAIRGATEAIDRFLPRIKPEIVSVQQNEDGSFIVSGRAVWKKTTEWPDEMPIRNGVTMVWENSGKRETLSVPKSGSFNTFTYETRSLRDGDSVYLEYDLGGYVVKSAPYMVEAEPTTVPTTLPKTTLKTKTPTPTPTATKATTCAQSDCACQCACFDYNNNGLSADYKFCVSECKAGSYWCDCMYPKPSYCIAATGTPPEGPPGFY
ncbi:MAG: hypothetical protein GYA23_09050 [Methanomicrobiales archaeon]|nr:hypothetical protein [Methanomicrobiales archaeon]